MSERLNLVIGLAVLAANVTLCAALTPARGAELQTPAGRLRAVWRVLFLALLQIGAWGVLLWESGAVDSGWEGWEEALRAFTWRNPGGDAGPWGVWVSLMALNGMLFLPVSVLSGWSVGSVHGAERVRQAESVREEDSAVQAKSRVEAGGASGNSVGTAEAGTAQAAAKPGTAGEGEAGWNKPFRGKIPMVPIPQEPGMPDFPSLPTARMRPIPPPIRFS
ncbi:MAG: hypothetical protein RLZZ244_3117 [Verrucomicrobiota bacterium]|jgi:hypothetical protein